MPKIDIDDPDDTDDTAVRSPVDESTTKKTIEHGDFVDTLPVAERADLTDRQWAVLEPLLPVGRKPGRPVVWTKRPAD
ncbi:transposase [Nonomuraea sp. NPDC050451]|uniref:transposase n=1 Tax=Nonomuraea sp. NPDC050451 TaxID=3364364 RepID=UPI0037AF5B2A